MTMPERARGMLAGVLLLAVLAALTALALAACGGEDDAVDTRGVPAATEPARPANGGTDDTGGATDTPGGAVAGEIAGGAPAPAPGAGGPSGASSANAWQVLLPSADLWDVAVADDGRVIMAAGRGQGLRSEDGGQTWTAVDWPGEQRSRLAMLADGATVMVAGIGPLAGFESGALFSPDGGATWTESLTEIQGVERFTGSAFLVAGLRVGLMVTLDGDTGRTLIPPDVGDPNFDPVDGAVDPHNPADLILALASEGGMFQLFRSQDQGRSVAEIETGLDLFGVTRVIYAGVGPVIASAGAGVLFTFDGGASWVAQNAGLEELLDGGFYNLRDLVDLPVSRLPFVAGPEAVYRFNPGGWTRLPGPGPEIRRLDVLPGENPGLLAATASGLYLLPNAGTVPP